MIFISHQSEDAAFANELTAAIEGCEESCWIAPRDIAGGTNWPAEIASAIHRSSILLLVLTKTANQSEHVQREIELAVAAKIPILPYRRDVFELCAGLQYLLSGVQFFDALTGGVDEHIDSLMRTLQSHQKSVVPAPPNPPPQPPGLEKWLARNRVFTVSVGLSLIVLLAWLIAGRQRPDTWPTPPPVALPPQVADIAAGDVLKTAFTEAPPNQIGLRKENAAPLAMALDLIALKKGDDQLRPLFDGDSLQSHDDLYLISVAAEAEGYLYVFQLDSVGQLTWLFPKNPTTEISTGANPVSAGRVLIPNNDEGLFLDATVGAEHVFAVFSKTQWPKLEESLSAAAVASQNESRAIESRLPFVPRGVASTRRLPAAVAKSVVLNGKEIRLDPSSVASVLQEANGLLLVVSRWFKHE